MHFFNGRDLRVKGMAERRTEKKITVKKNLNLIATILEKMEKKNEVKKFNVFNDFSFCGNC